jgi:hypothetical protein
MVWGSAPCLSVSRAVFQFKRGVQGVVPGGFLLRKKRPGIPGFALLQLEIRCI